MARRGKQTEGRRVMSGSSRVVNDPPAAHHVINAVLAATIATLAQSVASDKLGAVNEQNQSHRDVKK